MLAPPVAPNLAIPTAILKEHLSLTPHHHPCPMNALLVSHYPSKSTITLASPRKRGGGTAVEFFRLAVQYSDSLTFMILKQFQAVTVGIEIDRSTTLKILSFNNPHHNCLAVVFLNALVLSLFHIDKCIDSNSEPEKCYPTNSTIGSLLS